MRKVRTDTDVTVQSSSDDTSNKRKSVAYGLPRKGAHTLVREREGELALERVDKKTEHHVCRSN